MENKYLYSVSKEYAYFLPNKTVLLTNFFIDKCHFY